MREENLISVVQILINTSLNQSNEATDSLGFDIYSSVNDIYTLILHMFSKNTLYSSQNDTALAKII